MSSKGFGTGGGRLRISFLQPRLEVNKKHKVKPNSKRHNNISQKNKEQKVQLINDDIPKQKKRQMKPQTFHCCCVIN